MAEKTASIKLTLKSTAFKSGLKDASDTTKREAKGMGAALKSALSDGIKGAGSAVTSLFSSIKSGITSLGGLAGGLSLVGGIKGAIEAESRYRHLAFAIKAGTGQFVSFRDIQKQVQRAALDTGQSTEDLVGVYRSLFEEVGDQHFAADVMRSVGVAATASGEPVQTLAEIAGTLNEKFGITAGEMDSALASALSLSKKGGISTGQMAEKLGLVGAAAKTVGLTGEAGFTKIAAMLNIADDTIGGLKKSIPAVTGLIDMLGNKGERTKHLLKLGIDPSKVKGDAIEMIGQILKATGGRKEKLEAVFGGEQGRLMVGLGQTYAKAFAETAGDVKTKTAAAVAAYNEQITAAGKSSLTVADVQKQAAEELQTPEKQIATALTKLEQAFAKPEIINAVGRLAKSLPGLADMVGKFAGLVVDNPVMAGLGVAGAVAGKGFLEASIGSIIKAAFSSGGATAGGLLAKGITGAAPGFASIFGGALGPAAALLGAGIALWVAATIHDSKQAEEERRDRGKEATKILDADRQRINESLRQQGIETAPTAGLSPEMARRMTATKAEGDAAEQAIRAARAPSYESLSAEQKANFFNLQGALHPQVPVGGATPAGPSASVAPMPQSPDRFRAAPQDLGQILKGELKVRITNPGDIGTPAAVTPGWAGGR